MTSIELRLTGSHLIKQVSSYMRDVIGITTSKSESVPKEEADHLVVGSESTCMTIVDVVASSIIHKPHFCHF
jgi:hypothetical protein